MLTFWCGLLNCFLVLIYISSIVLFVEQVVAIKKMDLPPYKQSDGEREFRVEVDILSRLEHPNLVILIGYCADGKDRFLVYEFMPNGNLQDYLNGKFHFICFPSNFTANFIC